MKPKGPSEHEGMWLAYVEDIVGISEPVDEAMVGVERLLERQIKMNWLCLVEKAPERKELTSSASRSSLEGNSMVLMEVVGKRPTSLPIGQQDSVTITLPLYSNLVST